MSRFTILLFTIIAQIAVTQARVKRVTQENIDLSKPHRIFMTVGRTTMIDFPCEITPTIVGLTEDIKLTIGPDSKRTMSLWIGSEESQPTNMIVKCEGAVFVFDIIPNRENHQDYIDITNYFDGREKRNRRLISTSARPKARKELRRKLVDASSDVPTVQKTSRRLIDSSKKRKIRQHRRTQRLSLDDQEILRALNRKKTKRKLISTGVIQ